MKQNHTYSCKIKLQNLRKAGVKYSIRQKKATSIYKKLFIQSYNSLLKFKFKFSKGVSSIKGRSQFITFKYNIPISSKFLI